METAPCIRHIPRKEGEVICVKLLPRRDAGAGSSLPAGRKVTYGRVYTAFSTRIANMNHSSFAARVRLAFAPACLLLAGCAATGSVVVEPGPPIIVMPGAQQHRVDIPKGHYPPPGSCRIWIPGVPPGQQSPPGNCAQLRHRVPPGGVLVQG